MQLLNRTSEYKPIISELTFVELTNTAYTTETKSGIHLISYTQATLTCTCPSYNEIKPCKHVIALQHIISPINLSSLNITVDIILTPQPLTYILHTVDAD